MPLLQMPQRNARNRVARDDDHATTFVEKPLDALFRKIQHGLDIAPAVRCAARIAEIGEIRCRQRAAKFPQHAEPAVAAVEDADGLVSV